MLSATVEIASIMLLISSTTPSAILLIQSLPIPTQSISVNAEVIESNTLNQNSTVSISDIALAKDPISVPETSTRIARSCGNKDINVAITW